MTTRQVTTIPHGPESWRRALLPESATLQDAIRNLNETALKIALVISPDGRLVGTLTDGDIRRGLLRDLSLTSAIDPVVQRDPLVVPPDVGRETALRLMQANSFNAIPVVDKSRHVVGLHCLQDLLAVTTRPNLVVIMAGCRGSRLGAQTENCPKPLLPVAGKPMLEHIIEAARSEGFVRFAIAIHYLGHMIKEYFGRGDTWGVDISYINETQPLGTAGALSLLDPKPTAPFLVSNGDVLTDIRYGELLDFHVRHSAAATMAVQVHEWQHPFGVVHTAGVDITGFEEKPVTRTRINAGVYAFDHDVINALPTDQRLDMPELFERLRLGQRRTIVYPMHEPWLDVGRSDDLQRARDSWTPPSDSSR